MVAKEYFRTEDTRAFAHGIGPAVPHYYGDSVRRVFLLNAALMLITGPFFAPIAPVFLPFELLGAVVLVVLAGFTNPRRRSTALANTIASGLGVLSYEFLALVGFVNDNLYAFVARETAAIGFLFALYWSIKTFRAMILHQVGRTNTVGEFLEGGESEH